MTGATPLLTDSDPPSHALYPTLWCPCGARYPCVLPCAPVCCPVPHCPVPRCAALCPGALCPGVLPCAWCPVSLGVLPFCTPVCCPVCPGVLPWPCLRGTFYLFQPFSNFLNLTVDTPSPCGAPPCGALCPWVVLPFCTPVCCPVCPGVLPWPCLRGTFSPILAFFQFSEFDR